jgi:hypothetical protein
MTAGGSVGVGVPKDAWNVLERRGDEWIVERR